MLEKLYENNIKKLDNVSLTSYMMILNKADELLDELINNGFVRNLILLNESVVYKKSVSLNSIGVTSISLVISTEKQPRLLLTHGNVFKKINLLYANNIYYCIHTIEVDSSFCNISENDSGFFIDYINLKTSSNELNLTNLNLTNYSESNPLNIDSFIDSIYCHFGQLKLLKNVKCNYLSIENRSTNGRDMSKYKQIILDMTKNVNEYMIINLSSDEVHSSLCNSLDESSILFERYYTDDKYVLFINCKKD